MSFEIRGEGQRAERRRLRDRPFPVIGEMVYERQRRDKLAILGQMAFQSGRKLASPQSGFQVGAPFGKQSMRRSVKA